ncbi:MAG TPA: hypothetical protein VN577_01580 [Terriglobales bacterium]|nr:hypothetical protein [Terriglobales bacterium]
MRYLKGTIALSATRDYPLLRRVLHSTFVTGNQLFEFMRLEYCASSRKAFENRVRRLAAHALLVRHQIRDMNIGVVYAISPGGASELIARGEYYSGSPDRVEAVSGHVQHALELNEIHLALKRTGMLARWTPESDIRSRNELTDIGYGKDYDATVEVRIGGQEHRFALEYERTPKAKARYDGICKRIEAQRQLRHFLYIAPNHDLLAFLRFRFQACSQAIHFGLYRDVLADGFDVPVQANRGSATSRFSDVLGGLSSSSQQQKATP